MTEEKLSARAAKVLARIRNGEFIIDGVVNVRAALDAALAVERDGSATGTTGAAKE